MKILANDGISEAGARILKDKGHKLIENKVAQEQLKNFINENKVEVLLVRSTTNVRKDLIDACPSLKIIGRGGVGMDNIDLSYAQEKGIKVINTPSASSKSVAELVFAHFFTLARHLHDANRMMPLEGDTKFNQLKKNYTNAIELNGKTLGVIGMGRIGLEVAKIGLALGMKVLMSNRSEKTETLEISFFDGQKVNFNLSSIPLDGLLQQADFISINIPKTEDYLLDTPQFKQMKDGVILVNTARGGILSEKALLEAISSGKIGGAALDVFENEPTPETALLMNPSLSLSPHIGGNTLEAQERISIELAEQIIALCKV